MLEFDSIRAGDELPRRSYTPTNVSLFLYNAAIWNAHRIHYDAAYTTGVEKHPGIVVDGPLQGDWLTQVVLEWAGEAADLTEFQYSNRRACYLGDTLSAAGTVQSVDPVTRQVTVALSVVNKAETVTTSGAAVLRFRSK